MKKPFPLRLKLILETLNNLRDGSELHGITQVNVMLKLVQWVLLVLSWIALPAFSAPMAIPALTSPVTDLTQTLSPQSQQSLAQKLNQLSKEKGSQIAVLIVDTTQPEDIAQFGIRVAEAWKIGRDKQDDGVIIIVAKADRKMRIEVGYGLEGAIPDLTAKRVISETMAPRFRQGDFEGGLNAAIDQLTALIAGEALPAPQKKSSQGGGLLEWLPILMFVAIFTGMVLRSIFGTYAGSALNGGALSVLVWVLGGALLTVGLVFIAAFIFTLAMGGNRGGGYGGYPTGYGGGYGGGGLSGRDIFSGGGGDFGGGGASGDW
ncbi:beta-propeller domain-containing protein, methanol dehydrogenase [Methylophilaceae bacterium 11]|nr:beta-propeller domain-containing protein, methanol dehydrogenase [Methylophilaceae bacterium 11]